MVALPWLKSLAVGLSLFKLTSAVASSVTTKPTTTTTSTTSHTSTTAITATTATTSKPSTSPTPTPSTVGTITVKSTILVLVRDSTAEYSATSGLNGYGIPFQVVQVPINGITLPVLNSSATSGNYGGIVTMSELSYDMGGGNYSSAITPAQWNTIYNYQAAFRVRLVRLDAYPQPIFGTTTNGGCCDSGVDQNITLTNMTGFPTANLKSATLSTLGLWHYPAIITDPTTTWEVASLDPAASYTTKTSGAVINKFGTREQMVFFITWASEWSRTSNYLNHAWINWMTRGIFIGRRRIYLSTQVDDMHLSTDIYSPNGTTFRLRTTDLNNLITWQKSVNTRLPTGSSYFMEFGHNGNGDIDIASNLANTVCNPQTAIYPDDPGQTTLEYQKPVGTGTNKWPTTPATYVWSKACAAQDSLAAWFMQASNLNNFAHMSHTFSHLDLDNATYSDAVKEIQFNIAWLNQTGISAATKFSKGLIPPAITGLHNGDAIRAWMENGISAVVGDNSRPPLLNTQNEFWPLTSTVAANGYAGLEIMPRFSNAIYYNCDTQACTSLEWVTTSGGWGNFNDLLFYEKETTSRNLLKLRQDPYMFHQANLRNADMPSFTVGTQTGNFALIQIWVETVILEMARLTNWPVTTLKHDDIAKQFTNRQTIE
jgi:hypothetical protein